MHHYQHNIKTFNHATRHLTRVERSLYRDLIELYYDTEQPLPAVSFDKLCRLVLAHSDDEKAALKAVLDEFFVLTGEVYSHDYCDTQIEKYRTNSSVKAKAGKASAQARKAKSEQRQAKRKHTLNTCSTDVQLTSNQEPVTNNHKPIDKTLTSSGDDKPVKIDYQAIVDLFNSTLPELPSVKILTDKRRTAIRSCCLVKPKFSETGFWEVYFQEVRKSDFLMGRKTDWKADFDFLVTRSKFVKVVEGAY